MMTHPEQMKAIVYKKYGSPEVLRLKAVKKPITRKNEVLIKIKATAVNSGDLRLRKADPFAVRLFFGFIRPKRAILGSVFSGEIEAVGKDVKLYKAGEQVFGSTGMRLGSYAEYVCLPENAAFTIKPNNLTHGKAASIPFGAITALHFLRKVNIKRGQKILIYGASGAVGTAAVQLAKHFGANVTAVSSTRNLEMLKFLGADKTIDYTKCDFAKDRETYDFIYDTVGKISLADTTKSLNPNGAFLLSAAGPKQMAEGLRTAISGKIKTIFGVVREKPDDILFLKGLIESGTLKSVIDKSYALEQIREAHRYGDKGRKRGNIVITVS